MKLYMNPLSPNVRRVRLTAAVLELELEEKRLDFTKGEHKRPDYLALNGPMCVDQFCTLFERRRAIPPAEPALDLRPAESFRGRDAGSASRASSLRPGRLREASTA
jgi:hypothetical protein